MMIVEAPIGVIQGAMCPFCAERVSNVQLVSDHPSQMRPSGSF